MEEKKVGIVLKGVSFGENDKILSIFTLEDGTISASIKGVKKAGAKLKFAQEPFCFAEFMIAEKSNRKTVIGASLLDSFYPLREDIVKYFCGGTILEFIKHFAKENIVSPKLFYLSIDTLKQIAYGDCLPKLETVKFLINALKIAGYGLNFGGCFMCGNKIENRVYFNALTGSFFCENCVTEGAREINHKTYETLKDISENKEPNLDGLDMALKLIDYYLEIKTEEKLNSLKELLKI